MTNYARNMTCGTVSGLHLFNDGGRKDEDSCAEGIASHAACQAPFRNCLSFLLLWRLWGCWGILLLWWHCGCCPPTAANIIGVFQGAPRLDVDGIIVKEGLFLTPWSREGSMPYLRTFYFVASYIFSTGTMCSVIHNS